MESELPLLLTTEIQCIYALIERVIFAIDEEELKEGEDKLAVVLGRQLSYFADLESLGGLLSI